MRALRRTSAVAIIVAVVAARFSAGQRDPLAFFGPSVTLSTTERLRLDTDDVVVRTLPADDGHIAIFAATRLGASPQTLLQWTRRIEAFRQGFQVLGVGRFSEPVADSDLDPLVLDDGELDALQRCRIGNCDVKLAAAEIVELQHAIHEAGSSWREAAQHIFRRILIARIRLHRTSGLLILPPYADRGRRMSVGEAFSAIVARSPYLTRGLPGVVNSLLAPPAANGAEIDESFYYWSHDSYGAGKPIVTLTYVRLLRRDDAALPQTLTLSTQLFASHYMEGALALTAVTCNEARSRCYLAYLNRTQVDFLGGLFGRFKRSAIEGRIKAATPALLREVRERLENRARESEGDES